MSIGIGIVNVVGRSSLGGAGLAPITYLMRDQFTTDVDPLVDGPALPGPGTRDITGTEWYALGDALRGGVATGGALDGTERLVWGGQTRADGLTFAAYVILSDATDELTVGWATSASSATPTTDGYSWVNDTGVYAVATPSQLLTLMGNQENIRAIEYLVAVSLRSSGALYFLSAVSADHSAEQQDPYGIPAYPQARVLYLSDAATTTPLYPQIQAGAAVDATYPGLMYLTDARVVQVPEFTEAQLATVADHTTKSADNGTATAASADGIFHVKMTFGGAAANPCGIRFRQVDANNFIRVWNNNDANTIMVQSMVAGAFNATHFSTAYTWALGATYHFYVECRGSAVRVIVQREVTTTSVDSGWMTIGVHTTGRDFGSYEQVATTATWTNLVHYPHTVTLPWALTDGKVPMAWVPGSTVMTDTFTDTNGTSLSGRALSTGGGTWTASGGTWTIQSNKASVTAASGAVFLTTPYATDTFEIEVDFTIDNPYSAVLGGIVFYHSADGYVAVRPLSGARDEIELVENSDAGGFTGIAHKQDLTDALFVAGSTYNLRVQVTPSLVRVYLDDVIKLSHALSQTFSGTGVGLYDEGNYTLDFDNFTVRALTTPAGSTLDSEPPTPPADAFPTVANVLWRYRAESEGLSDGALVGTATDRSGNARNATASGATRPTLETGVINGKAVYRFAGTNDCLQVPSFAMGTPTVTLYAVLSTTDSTTLMVVYEHSANYGGGFDRFYTWKSTTDQLEAGLQGDVGFSNFTTTNDIPVNGTFVAYRVLWNKAAATNEVAAELAHVATGTRTNNSNNAANNFGSHIGYIGARNATSAGWVGDIAEIFLISGDPSAGEKTAIDAYFLSEYGV